MTLLVARTLAMSASFYTVGYISGKPCWVCVQRLPARVSGGILMLVLRMCRRSTGAARRYIIPGGSAGRYQRQGYTFDVGSSMMFGMGQVSGNEPVPPPADQMYMNE